MLQAVIFDRDGVLIDSEQTNIDSGVQALRELGIELDSSDISLIIGRHAADYGNDFLKKYVFSYEEFRKIQRSKYTELFNNAPIFEETVKLAKDLFSKKIILGLATSSSKNNTINFLNKYNLKNCFKVVTTCEDYDKRKPDPAPYIITAQKLNVEPRYCVAIEDTAIGVESAKNAGMKCIAIPNQHTFDQDFSKADIMVKSGNDITIELLERLVE